VQEIVGGIEARLAVNARLIDSFAGGFDDGVQLSPPNPASSSSPVTNNAVAILEDALSLTSNHGLTRANPLERHLSRCAVRAGFTPAGRRHTRQRRTLCARRSERMTKRRTWS
jgi:hypothetical protein